MAAPSIERALASLSRVAAAVQEIQSEIDARDMILEMSGVPDLLPDLVAITKRRPELHLGHLSLEGFERVRARLGAQVELHVHPDGARYLIIEENRGGFVIRAQTTPPAASEEPVAQESA